MSDVNDNATDDLRSALASAYDGEPVEAVENEAPAIEAAESTSSTRNRNERGQFEKKQEAEQAAAAEGQIEQAVEVQAEAPLVPPKRAPQSWKAEVKAHFNALPLEVQDEILRRESDFNKGIQKYAEDAKYAQTFRQATQGWEPYFSQLQTTPDEMLKHLVGHEYTLRMGSPAQKQAKIMELAEMYGIPLGENQYQPNQLDPNVQHALTRVQQLEAYIQNAEYGKKQEAARQQAAEMAELTEHVNEFSSGADVPHFEDVRADMAQLLQAGQAKDLKDAYEKACWIRPDIRASLLKEEETKRIQNKAQAANQAKARAVSVTGTASGANIPVAGASIRDDLMSAWDGNRI